MEKWLKILKIVAQKFRITRGITYRIWLKSDLKKTPKYQLNA